MNERNKTKRALLTGASGYIGSKLATKLHLEGWQVDILCRPSSDLARISTYQTRFQVHRWNGSTKELVEILERSAPDLVFHLAAIFLMEHSLEQFDALVESNLLLPSQLLEAMARTGHLRLVNTGSAGQHFNNSEYDPLCLYAAQKQALEEIIAYYVVQSQLQAITLKIYDTYGPDDPRKKILDAMQQAVKTGTPLEMSSAKQELFMVHVDDIVSAFLTAGSQLLRENKPGHQAYSLPAEAPITLGQLVELYETLSGKNVPVKWEAKKRRGMTIADLWKSGTPLPEWHAKISIEEGIKQVISQREPGPF